MLVSFYLIIDWQSLFFNLCIAKKTISTSGNFPYEFITEEAPLMTCMICADDVEKGKKIFHPALAVL